jgi:hypothetical protein
MSTQARPPRLRRTLKQPRHPVARQWIAPQCRRRRAQSCRRQASRAHRPCSMLLQRPVPQLSAAWCMCVGRFDRLDVHAGPATSTAEATTRPAGISFIYRISQNRFLTCVAQLCEAILDMVLVVLLYIFGALWFLLL